MTSLRFRLTIWFALAVTVTACAAAWIGFLIVQRQVMHGIDFLLAAEIQEIVARLGDAPPNEVNDAIQGHTEIDAAMYFFQIHRLGHGVIFRSRNLGTQELPDLSDGGPLVHTVWLDDEPLRQMEHHHGEFHIQVATNLEQVEALIDRYQHATLLGVPLVLMASLLIGWVLGTVALRPVRAMQRSAERISATNLAGRLPVSSRRDEIADLARLLNDLFARLEASFDQVRRFTADASHELKTPLSLIRLHAERLARSPQLDDSQRADLESQIEEINRLNKLVESLLLLAQADAGSLRLDARREDPAAFVREIGEDALVLAEDQGLVFEIVENTPGEAVFDRVMLRQVLLNLLSNALRHSPPGGHIRIASSIDAGRWKVSLEDQGPGLPPHQLESIFGRFVRGQTTSSKEAAGSGLGLAIARSIVESHHGTIKAENVPKGGLRIIVEIPGATAQSLATVGAHEG